MVKSYRKVRAQVGKGSRTVTHTHTHRKFSPFFNKNMISVYLEYCLHYLTTKYEEK